MYRIVNRRKLWATRLADGIGRVIFGKRRSAGQPRIIAPEAVKTILVIRTAYIGDVVMTLPMLTPLRRRFPGARLTFLTSSAARPLLTHHPSVDEILTYDPFWFYPGRPRRAWLEYRRMIRNRSFDLIIDARADIRNLLGLVEPLCGGYRVSYGVGGGAYLLTHVVPYDRPMHKVDYHLNIVRFLGGDVDRLDWGLNLTDQERAEARATLCGQGVTGRFAAIHPGSRLPLKQWDPLRYAVVADRIVATKNLPVVWLGAEADRTAVDQARGAMQRDSRCLVGQLSLRELAAMLADADVLICNDSAPMHVAVAVGTPVVAVFGPSKSNETGPYGSMHRAVERPIACRAACDEHRCRNAEKLVCLRSVSVDDVWCAASERIDARFSESLRGEGPWIGAGE